MSKEKFFSLPCMAHIPHVDYHYDKSIVRSSPQVDCNLLLFGGGWEFFSSPPRPERYQGHFPWGKAAGA